VDGCWRLTVGQAHRIGLEARQSYLDGKAGFEVRFKKLINHVSEIGGRELVDLKSLSLQN